MMVTARNFGLAALVAALLCAPTATLHAQVTNVHELFQQALRKERTNGDLQGAIRLYEQVAAGTDRALAARALLRAGEAYEKLGVRQAVEAYQRLVREFADQPEPVAAARLRLSALATAAAPAQPAARGLVVTQMASHPKIGLLGQVSPDGRFIGSVDWDSGELEVHELETGARRALTGKESWSDNYEYAEISVWSPDGRRLAYGWYNDQEFYELRAIDANGSAPVTVFRDPEVTYLWPAAWHPSGSHILAVLEYRDRSSRLALLPQSGGQPVFLRSFPSSGPLTATFSPDGRWIVFDAAPAGDNPQRDLHVIAADGSRQHAIVEHPARDVALGWTADGSGLLFTSNRRGTTDIWYQPLEDARPAGEPVVVRSDVGRIAGLGFDRAGAFYYGNTLSLTDVLIAGADLAAGRLSGEARLAARGFEGRNSHPDWSPDGRWFGWLSSRPNPVIVVRDELTGAERTLPLRTGRVFDLRIAPGGRTVLFSAWQGEQRGLFLGDFESGEIRSFVKSAPAEGVEARPLMPMHAWSADGRTAYFTRKGNGAHRLVARDVASGDERELFRISATTGESLIFNPAPSPDGRRLVFSAVEGVPLRSAALMVLELETGTVRELLRTQAWLAPFGWTPDGSSIIYLADEATPDLMGAGGTVTVYHISAAGGKPVRTALPGTLRRVHPDGTRIAIFRSNDRTEVWRLENYVPAARQ